MVSLKIRRFELVSVVAVEEVMTFHIFFSSAPT